MGIRWLLNTLQETPLGPTPLCYDNEAPRQLNTLPITQFFTNKLKMWKLNVIMFKKGLSLKKFNVYMFIQLYEVSSGIHVYKNIRQVKITKFTFQVGHSRFIRSNLSSRRFCIYPSYLWFIFSLAYGSLLYLDYLYHGLVNEE